MFILTNTSFSVCLQTDMEKLSGTLYSYRYERAKIESVLRICLWQSAPLSH
jgi:hypothetical protein